MIQQIKVCFLKQIWESVNNKKKLLISMFINCFLVIFFFFRTSSSSFLGLDFLSIILVYTVIWITLMSFSLVNDVISELNKCGIMEQIFLSSFNLNGYIFVQVLQKGFFSIFFITIIINLCNLLTCTFSFELLLSFVLTLCIGIFSTIGVAYIISSITLLINYKNASLFFRMLMLVVIVKSDKNILIPFSYCKCFLVDLFSRNQCIWDKGYCDLIGLVLNSIIYFIVGIFVFAKLFSKRLLVSENF